MTSNTMNEKRTRNGEGHNAICVEYRLVPDIKLLKTVYTWLETKPAVLYRKEGSSKVVNIRFDGKTISHPEIKRWSSSTRHVDWKTFDD